MVTPSGICHAVSLTNYTIEDLELLIDTTPRLELDPEVAERIDEGARFVLRKAAEDVHVYGTNTGFGAMCETRVGPEQMSDLQYRHVVSHACGIGDPVSVEVSRLTLFIKLLTFRSGHTGITPTVVSRLLDFWNEDVIPVIPKKGTVGASGDLSPLAHLALPLLGLGKFHTDGKILPASEVMAAHRWEPLTLQPKEGLALTNGVQYINAIGAQALMQLGRLIRLADVIAALSIQAFSCSRTFYQAILHETSLHEERRTVAANLRTLLDGSNHYELSTCAPSKQDPYSFRCTPQVHAAVRQAYRFGKEIIEKECNSVSDNPLFFPAHDVFLSGGNLHGESTAMVLDFLAIAASELASISERRTYQLLSGRRGLPDFLIPGAGLNSGFMVTQYTSAALVNENKVLSTPASVDSIMTCQLQEDHVSMGGTSAYKLCQILDNCEYVLAIELLNAIQAIDLNPALRPSLRTLEVADDFRSRVDFIDTDVLMSDRIENARRMLCERARDWTTGIA